MFLVNSRLDLFTATPSKGAPLVPKLRGHVAEFLRESSLAPLGILYPPTCVGFQYGSEIVNVLGAFLGSQTPSLPVRRQSYSLLRSGRFLRPSSPRMLEPVTNFRLTFAFFVPPHYYFEVQEFSPVVHRLRLVPSP